MRVKGDDGIKIFVFITGLHSWHLKEYAMYPGYFRLSQMLSQVPENDLQYLRMMKITVDRAIVHISMNFCSTTTREEGYITPFPTPGISLHFLVVYVICSVHG